MVQTAHRARPHHAQIPSRGGIHNETRQVQPARLFQLPDAKPPRTNQHATVGGGNAVSFFQPRKTRKARKIN